MGPGAEAGTTKHGNSIFKQPMTGRHNSAISLRIFARGLLFSFRPTKRGRGECRAPNAPAAWWAGKGRRATPAVVTTSYRKHPAFPHATVYSLLRALPGEPGLFATVASGINSTGFDTSVGVSGPHDFAVRFRYLRLGTIRVHRIPFRVIDVAQRPSVGRDDVDVGRVVNSEKQNIFS
jgi:hypothetical protein